MAMDLTCCPPVVKLNGKRQASPSAGLRTGLMGRQLRPEVGAGAGFPGEDELGSVCVEQFLPNAEEQ